jgi:ParB-like chromosome segregation protein Spo0J
MDNKLQFDYINISELIPYARNSRLHSDAQINQLCSSIKEFGFISPVVIDKNNVIIAGHGRVLAANKLKIEQVPCVRAEHLTDTQIRAYCIVDNRLAETSTWDTEMLSLELKELEELDFDVSIMSFDDKKLSEETEEIPEEKDSKLKDDFLLIIKLPNESEQASLYESLTTQGFEVKIP